MEPRRPTSQEQEFTRVPSDLLAIIRQTLEAEFATHLDNWQLSLDGRIYPTEILLGIGLKRPTEIRQINFEASVDFDPLKGKPAIDRVHWAAEAISSTVEQFLSSDEDLDTPKEWTKFDFEKEPIWIRSSTMNYELEKQADELLAQVEPKLEQTELH